MVWLTLLSLGTPTCVSFTLGITRPIPPQGRLFLLPVDLCPSHSLLTLSFRSELNFHFCKKASSDLPEQVKSLCFKLPYHHIPPFTDCFNRFCIRELKEGRSISQLNVMSPVHSTFGCWATSSYTWPGQQNQPCAPSGTWMLTACSPSIRTVSDTRCAAPEDSRHQLPTG